MKTQSSSKAVLLSFGLATILLQFTLGSLFAQTNVPGIPGFVYGDEPNAKYNIRFDYSTVGIPTTNRSASKNPKGATLCVMSFNLRYASATPPNAWPDRRPLVKEVLTQYSPDVIGTQEGLYHQIKNIAADSPVYDWIGTGRDGGSRGEFMAIFYKRAELEPLEYDHFWLSDTPDVIGSTTWGNSNRRMVTWVKFRHIESATEFYFFNTHFDHEIQPAREKSAALVRSRLESLKTDLPLVLVGDFNANAEVNKAYKILTAEDFLADTWKTALIRRNEGISTFNSFKGPNPKGPRIDWILSRGAVTADEAEIVTFSQNGQYPSDHFPIVVWLKVGGKK
jgi:endonuclease/exonuclease/phosphatase family metal-dependent hydrolase